MATPWAWILESKASILNYLTKEWSYLSATSHQSLCSNISFLGQREMEKDHTQHCSGGGAAGGAQGPYVVPGFQHGLFSCKASILIPVLFGSNGTQIPSAYRNRSL